MFGLAFSLSSESDSDLRISKIVMFMSANQVRIWCLSVASITSSHSRTDLRLIFSAVYICMFHHSYCIASTAWPATSCIRPPPDPRQPHRWVVTCDVVGSQGGRNPILSCWYSTRLVRRMAHLYFEIGTSDHSLPPVKMDCVYAGSSGFHPSISRSGCDFPAYN